MHAQTAVKGERVTSLQPIARESLFASLITNRKNIGLCLLGPPQLSVGISGHGVYFLCKDKRRIVLPNNCDPTSIARLALLGNKKRQAYVLRFCSERREGGPVLYSLVA